ncbi:LPXTG cell wall anchor domain-containing protein [Arcanobacterium haemolyticum]|uniref:LPXTG cell wall anchor domain-containing protein n=1 Tax=Arcanobacterium haemolyticum TaxID=28264 RepID=UPI00031B01FE|nr:LPXTG cell wall anchor domain-containing protein [Arcanobacterium haemolyticum]QCX46000.1 LPXTG cell wall anchor domain-containing protein [Arcanobacterium haemolyticum]
MNISINDQAIVADLGNIENTRAQALKVPLTGGMSSQAFLFGGLIFFGATVFALWRSRKSHA